MRIAIIGCGYVADFYLKTLSNHPELQLVGVMDQDLECARRLAKFYRIPKVYHSLQEVLDDPQVELVANLTNPSSHYAVSRAALEAGKHVYSEKPLAMTFSEAEELVLLAERLGLQLAGAPCSVLGETAQTLWKALREERIGRVRLVYAEIDDGPIHLMNPQAWRSASGAPWPVKDEFEVGCTLEHAGYYVTWLVAFFGPARTVTSFSSLLTPDKGVVLDRQTPDFSVACIEFASGVVARLTCSIFAPHDHGLQIIGDKGVLSISECWDNGSPVYLRKRNWFGLKAEKYPLAAKLVGLGPRRLPFVRKPKRRYKFMGTSPMDFSRGLAEVAEAITQQRPCRLSSRFALHVNEIVLAIQSPEGMGSPRQLTTTCTPMEPMAWA